MSLVSTYVKATDGFLYRNPVLEGKGWFICFDDDDPVELVVTKESGISDPQKFLKELGIEFANLSKGDTSGLRMFKRTFKEAKNWFFELTNRIDPQLIIEHDGKTKI